MIWIGISIGIAVALGSFIICAFLWKDWNKKFSSLENDLRFQQKFNQELIEELQKKESENKDDSDFIKNQQVVMQVNDKRIAEQEDQINHLQGEIEKWRVDLQNCHDGYCALLDKKDALENDVSKLNEQLAEKDSVTGEINELRAEMQRLIELKELTRKEENEGYDGIVWSPELGNKEERLVKVLGEIKEMYPELSGDLATIEWKKIWLPKIQEVSRTLEDRGIYRLILKEDKDIGYVGQAVNIKERWYQHIKKMIGVLPVGAEKLYKYRPEDFNWSIIERGNNVDLNESEKFWIQYFGLGLNKKL